MPPPRGSLGPMRTVLFLCTANSCRSQMAEAFARALGGVDLRAWSAGTHPTRVDPRAQLVMAEVGHDLEGHAAKAVQHVPIEDIDTLVTLCEEAERCVPAALSGVTDRQHWPVEDPAEAAKRTGDPLAAYRRARDDIRRHVEVLLAVAAKKA